MDNDIKNKIYEKVQAQLDAKMAQAQEAARNQAERDREKVEIAIEMISSRLVYKDIGGRGWGHKYVLATEEMFYEDYLKEPESIWQKGLKFNENDGEAWYKGIFTVNGETYYDIHYILAKYQRDVYNVEEELKRRSDYVREIREKYDRAVRDWPEVKKVVEDWNKLRENADREE